MLSRRALLHASAVTAAGLAPLAAKPRTPPRKTAALKTELDAVAGDFHGALGYALHHFGTGDRLSLRGDEPFPSASTIKLAVMGEAFRRQQAGEIGYYEAWPLEKRHVRGGAGFLQNYREGVRVELKELLHLMITVSDNTATAWLVEKLGTPHVNAWLDARGLPKTRLLTQLPGDASADLKQLAATFGLGVTTPSDMVALMAQLRDGKAGTPAACDEMRRLLSHQYFDDLIAGSVPPGVQVASKSGALNQSRSDVALVSAPSGDYALAVFTKENTDQRWTRENEAEQAIRTIAAKVWAFCEPNRPYMPPPGTAKF